MRQSALLSLFVAILGLGLIHGPLSAATLDGQSFSGKLMKKGATSGDPDELIFANGTFDPTACHAYGFTATSYTSQASEGKTSWSAKAVNDKGETMEWSGTVQGNSVHAAATYTPQTGEPVLYSYTGTAKSPMMKGSTGGATTPATKSKSK
jgi:hypothetical protein